MSEENEENQEPEPTVVADIEKPNGEVVRVQLKEFKGKEYLDIRTHYYADEDELRPTKKGISLSTDLFTELKEAILKAEEEF